MLKEKKSFSILLFCLVGIFVLTSFSTENSIVGLDVTELDTKATYDTTTDLTPQNTLNYEVRSEIVISSDSDFTDANGVIENSGTEFDPHIIEGWSITTSSTVHAISITDTTDYFVIRDCWLFASGISTNAAGIRIEDVQEGTTKIQNNIIQEFEYGIRVVRTNSCVIEDNICNSNRVGIILSQYGSSGWASFFTEIINNTCNSNEYGISVPHSQFCTISSNVCNFNTIDGMDIFKTFNSNLTHNICNENTENGIDIRHSDDLEIMYNYSFNNTIFGIRVLSCNRLFVYWNLFVINHDYGISIEGNPGPDYTTNHVNIHHNSFIYNNDSHIQAFNAIDTDFIKWDNTVEGNYWSNWNIQFDYEIDGLINTYDHHPMEYFDFDLDGMYDQWEYDNGLNLIDSSDANLDPDADGLINLGEFTYGTDINNQDSDGDGWFDGSEDQAGEDPATPNPPPTVIWGAALLNLNGTETKDSTFEIDINSPNAVTMRLFLNGFVKEEDSNFNWVLSLKKGENIIDLFAFYDLEINKYSAKLYITYKPLSVLLENWWAIIVMVAGGIGSIVGGIKFIPSLLQWMKFRKPFKAFKATDMTLTDIKNIATQYKIDAIKFETYITKKGINIRD